MTLFAFPKVKYAQYVPGNTGAVFQLLIAAVNTNDPRWVMNNGDNPSENQNPDGSWYYTWPWPHNPDGDFVFQDGDYVICAGVASNISFVTKSDFSLNYAYGTLFGD